MTDPNRPVLFAPKRKCARCKQHRPIKGGTTIHGAYGFLCADCRPARKSAPPSKHQS